MVDLVEKLDFVFTVPEFDDIINRISILSERLRVRLQRLQKQYQTEVDAFDQITVPQLQQQASAIEENCHALQTADLFAALVGNTAAIAAQGISLDVDGELNSI